MPSGALVFSLLLGVPAIAAATFHLLLKPKFWLPVFATALCVGLIAAALALIHPPENGLGAIGVLVIFSALGFCVAAGVGLVFRWLFKTEYLAFEEHATHSKNFVLRSRIVGAIAMLLGVTILSTMAMTSRPFNLNAALGGILFVFLGASYLFSSRGGSTLKGWIFRGKLTGGASSNNSVNRTPHKKRARRRLP